MTLPNSKLPTNLTTDSYPIHKWFNFTAGFSPEFVSNCIREDNLSGSDILIDPFSGFSTSLVQANFEGIISVGYEPHPFFFDISQAKIFPPRDTSTVERITEVLAGLPPFSGKMTNIWSEDAVKFLGKLVPETELLSFASALLAEDVIEPKQKSLYRLMVSRMLELACGSQTDGIYKAPTSLKKSISYEKALLLISNEVKDDIEKVGDTIAYNATLYQSSSEQITQIENESCSICVTSPPYLNNFDFAEMKRMEIYFWRYAGSWREITEKIRRRLIVNTTTAPTDLKRSQDRFRSSLSIEAQEVLAPLVNKLDEVRKNKGGKKDYYLLVYPYYAQIQSVFRELYRILKPGSKFHLVVGDSALYGIHIETQHILALLLGEVGFRVASIEQLRSRGDRWILEKRQGAKKGLGEYHIVSERA